MLLATLMGAGAQVTLENQFVFDSGGVAAGIEYLSDGGIEETTAIGGVQPLGEWLVPAALAPGSYEIRATLNSGSVFGTTGAWLPLTTNRGWSVGAGGEANLTIEIRSGSGPVEDSCNVQLDANP